MYVCVCGQCEHSYACLRDEKPMSRENIEQRSLAWTRPPARHPSIFDGSRCPCATNGSQVPGYKKTCTTGRRDKGCGRRWGGRSVSHKHVAMSCRLRAGEVEAGTREKKLERRKQRRGGGGEEDGTDGILRRHTMSREIPDSWKLVVQGIARRRDIGMWSDAVGWRRVEGYVRGVDNWWPLGGS